MKKYPRHIMPGWLHCFIVLALLGLMCPFGLSAAGKGDNAPHPRTIRVVMDDNYPPYIFKDSSGRLKGILPDQWRLWEQKTGIHAELHAMDWAEAQRRMQAGEFDVIDTIFRSEKRERIYDFTKPYARLDVPLYFRSDISGISDINDLKGFAVGVKAGGNVIDVLKSKGITNLIEFNNYEAIVSAARDHKINVFTVEKPPAYYFLYKFGINDQFRETKPLYTGEFHRAVAKGNQALLETVENGFARITKAEYDEIEKRWYGSPILSKGQVRYLWLGSIVVAALFSGLFLWLWMLRRAVAQRTADLQIEIKARRDNEALLKRSEERFRSFVENANDVVFCLSTEGVFTYVSPKWKDAFGYELGETIGKPFVPFVHPDDVSACFEFLKLVMDAGRKQSGVEYRVLHKNGSWIWYAANGSLIHYDDGSVTFLGIGRDITGRKEAEETLRQSHAMLTNFSQQVPGALFQTLISPDGHICTPYSSEKLRDLYELSPEDIREDATVLINRFHPDDRDRVMASVMEAATTLTMWACEYRVILPRQGVKWLYGTAQLQRMDDGTVVMYGIIMDNTEQHMMQNEVLKAQKLESIGILAGGIAHDFNNIITAIMGNISLACKYLDASHKSFGLLLTAEKASKRAADLAHQLLTFAKGSQPIKGTVSARQLVESSASLILRGSSVQCRINVPEDLHALIVDEGQISQVFNNLILNAVQAMPDGGTIGISAENIYLDHTNVQSLSPGEYVRFTFADSGCGIGADDLKKIFDPYFTTKPGGSGLGLASAYSIITKHGGHISVNSEVHRGTTFHIVLPASDQPAPEPEADKATDVPETHVGCSLLVMDDEQSIRDLTIDMLTELGYCVRTCATGEEAIALYRTAKEAGEPFSAVIMDLTVPGGMGGKEAAQHILQMDPAACLVVSSGYSTDPVMAEYARFGFSATMAKPYTVAEFSRVLQRVLTPSSPEQPA